MLPFALVNQHVLPSLGPFVVSLASKATIQMKWHSALSKVPWASLLAVGLHQCSRREARSSSLYGRRTTPLDLVLLLGFAIGLLLVCIGYDVENL